MSRIRSHNSELELVGNRIEGYAILYDNTSHLVRIGYKVGRERIKPGACRRNINGKKKIPVHKLHNTRDIPLAVYPDTAIFEDRPRGLWVSFESPSEEISKAVQSKRLGEWSFDYTPVRERWVGDVCEVEDMNIKEISLVVQGAYPNTQVNLRDNSYGLDFRLREVEIEKEKIVR
jgi:HK97 family phage prohead protease